MLVDWQEEAEAELNNARAALARLEGGDSEANGCDVSGNGTAIARSRLRRAATKQSYRAAR